MGTFRGACAENEKSPLPIPKGAAVEVGREETALFRCPEAPPELPTLLYIRVAEEKLRDSPTERPARPPSLLACENTEVKVEPGPFMCKAGAITDNMGLRARGVPAEGARGDVDGEVRGGDCLIFPVPREIPQVSYLRAPLGDAALRQVPGFGGEGRCGLGPAGWGAPVGAGVVPKRITYLGGWR